MKDDEKITGQALMNKNLKKIVMQHLTNQI